jgi:hypothetical protein
MRTTVELPPDLMRRAKARAASRGESFKALLTRAVATELDREAPSRPPRERVALPLFGDVAGPVVNVTSAGIARALAAAEAARAKPSRGRR